MAGFDAWCSVHECHPDVCFTLHDAFRLWRQRFPDKKTSLEEVPMVLCDKCGKWTVDMVKHIEPSHGINRSRCAEVRRQEDERAIDQSEAQRGDGAPAEPDAGEVQSDSRT